MNSSYLRFPFQHLPHDPDIMSFSPPFLKDNNLLGTPPISMPPSASRFLASSLSYPVASIV